MKPVNRLLLAALITLPLAVQAADPELLPVKVSFLSEINVAPDARDSLDAWGDAAGTDRLARTTGKDDTMHTEAVLGGTVGNNTAINTVSGSNTINGGSFANSQGLPVVIQNSGSNVLIQSATVINLRLQ
ncbi:hypothetical protein [Massilia sp. H6]|uniref:hypothetical protein n=1 Tax=Massilia sp. H6 TaxID=2970464 RepID=UPI002169CE3B|nr:hypothetical protein [Massilia sp. H6]UVW29172.1 hypothetical protein NRS07_03225 [Massilia sp. H6]